MGVADGTKWYLMRRKERKEAKIGVFDEDDLTLRKSPKYPPLEFPEVDDDKLQEMKEEIKEEALAQDKRMFGGFVIFLIAVLLFIVLWWIL